MKNKDCGISCTLLRTISKKNIKFKIEINLTLKFKIQENEKKKTL